MIVKAPFTDEQVAALNAYQKHPLGHEFTCCSPESIPSCLRAVREVDGQIIEGTSNGTLIATNEGWVCPCGEYRQDWAHDFMLEGDSFKIKDRYVKQFIIPR